MAKRYCAVAALVLIFILILTPSPLLAVPGLINYQGKLSDSGGIALNGTFSMTFRLYVLASGGSSIWDETQSVLVTDGIYSAQLGAVNPLTESYFSSDGLYLEVVVGGETLSPRAPLTSTAFSMRAAVAEDADTLDGKDSMEFAGSGHKHDGADIIMGTVATARIASSITRDSELTAGLATKADATHSHDASELTSGTLADARVPGGITRDSEVMGIVKNNAGPGSGLDADLLDGLHASSFLSAASDYGRSGVSSNLYEGTISLTNKYVNQSGDDMTGRLTATKPYFGTGFQEAIKGSLMGGSAIGAGVYGYTEGATANGVYGGAIGTDGVGVYGEATGSSGTGVKGQAPAGGWAGYFSGRLYASGNVGIGTADPQEKLHVAGDIQMPSNSSIKNANGRAVFHTGWRGDFGAYTTIASGYDWNVDGEPVSIVAGENGVFFTKGDATNTPHAETLIKVDTSGRLTCNVLEIKGGSDIAEPFETQTLEDVKAGMVMAIDPGNAGKLKISDKAYDRRVAGIVSGAGGVNAGMLMTQKGSTADGTTPIALSGRVYCQADASNGPIEPGDLLTTSDTPGHAMKVTDYAKAQGAILGKAMTSLEKDKGLVLVLVTLQ